MSRCLAPALAALACTLLLAAQAIQVCELDGQPVNPTNGSTTAGKTGLMRCRDGDGRSCEFAATPGATNPVLRDEMYRDGTAIGLVRRKACAP